MGESAFSVDGKSIRYGLSAIKSVGKPVIEAIVTERMNRGPYKSLKDFIERLSGKEVNKRTIESFIKAGALDGLGGTRKQFMMIYVQIMDSVNQERKYSLTGQMSLFDLVGEEEKKNLKSGCRTLGNTKKSSCSVLRRKCWAYISAVIPFRNMKRDGVRISPR